MTEDMEESFYLPLDLDNPFKEFCAYLDSKEQLSSRTFSFDELDFAGKFLVDRDVVTKCMNDNQEYKIEGKQPILTFSPKRLPFQVKHIKIN